MEPLMEQSRRRGHRDCRLAKRPRQRPLSHPDEVVEVRHLIGSRSPLHRGSSQRPVLDRDREDAVILPDTGDVQVAACQALLPEAALLEDSDRGAVAWDYCRLNAVKVALGEGKLDCLPHGLRGEADAADVGIDPVAEMCALESAAYDIVQVDGADD